MSRHLAVGGAVGVLLALTAAPGLAGLCEEWAGCDTTPYYHEPSDTFDTINFEYLKSTTMLVHYAFAYQLRPDHAAERMAMQHPFPYTEARPMAHPRPIYENIR